MTAEAGRDHRVVGIRTTRAQFEVELRLGRVFTKSVGQSPVSYRSSAAMGLAMPPPRQIP